MVIVVGLDLRVLRAVGLESVLREVPREVRVVPLRGAALFFLERGSFRDFPFPFLSDMDSP